MYAGEGLTYRCLQEHTLQNYSSPSGGGGGGEGRRVGATLFEIFKDFQLFTASALFHLSK
jgi:hypothetical protein